MILAAPQQLKIVGKQVQTLSGCNYRLVGVNIPGLEWQANGMGPPSGGGGDIRQSITAAVNTWKANVIRIPLDQDFWFGYSDGNSKSSATQNTTYMNNYRTIVDGAVTTASNLGCYVELDLHWSGTGSWGSTIGAKQQDLPDTHSTDFWQDVATRYANNPAVLFNLYNEPKGSISWALWKNGGTVTSITPNFNTPGFQSLVTTIRNTGANNIIVAGGINWAWDMTGIAANALTDTGSGNGVMYEAHIYDNKGGSNETAKIALWNSNVTVAVAAGYCVMIGEFGPVTDGSQDDTGCTPFESDLISWINGNNTQNYAYNAMGWDWHQGAAPKLISDWSFTPTGCHGTQVKNWLAAVTAPSCGGATTPVVTVTWTRSYTLTPTRTATMTYTKTVTPTFTRTSTLTYTLTATLTASPTFTRTFTPTYTQTATLTRTQTATPTFSLTASSTSIPSATFTRSVTATYSATPTNTWTATVTPTWTVTPTFTIQIYSPTNTPTNTIFISRTSTATSTGTASFTVTATATETQSPANTFTQTATVTVVINSPTFTPTFSVTYTETNTPTVTQTGTKPFTSTMTATRTNTATTPYTPTQTSTTQADTATNTPVDTVTFTVTSTPSIPSTPTLTPAVFKISAPAIYPNPVSPYYDDLKMRISITQAASEIKIRIYTVAMRRIIEIAEGSENAKEFTITIPKERINLLSAGVYHVVVLGKSVNGEKAASKPAQFIILR